MSDPALRRPVRFGDVVSLGSGAAPLWWPIRNSADNDAGSVPLHLHSTVIRTRALAPDVRVSLLVSYEQIVR